MIKVYNLSRIVDLYKARWHIELFFKWIKQNLKLKDSMDAIIAQVFIAMIAYILIKMLAKDLEFRQEFRKLMNICRTQLISKFSIRIS